MLGFAFFRGMRIGEIVACNLYDFQNENFHNFNLILEKSHIADDFPLLSEFSKSLKNYIKTNRHTMKNGYLFPSLKGGVPMKVSSAEAMFAKLRNEIGKYHPEFLDRKKFLLTSYLILKYIDQGITEPKLIADKLDKKVHNIRDKITKLKRDGYINFFMKLSNKGKDYISEEKFMYRYRISWHSCRRWFETRIWNVYKDKMLLRDVMRYKDSKTCDVYIDSYEVWKNESQILEDTFGDFYQNLTNIKSGQTKLNKFF